VSSRRRFPATGRRRRAARFPLAFPCHRGQNPYNRAIRDPGRELNGRSQHFTLSAMLMWQGQSSGSRAPPSEISSPFRRVRRACRGRANIGKDTHASL